jgi:hypothetical protein
MFGFLKRWAAPPPAPTRPRTRPVQKQKTKGPRDPLLAPVPVPQVVGEGNEETDWALWEDSMTALDSQKQGLVPRASDYDKLNSSQFDDVDAFASVRKRDS